MALFKKEKPRPAGVARGSDLSADEVFEDCRKAFGKENVQDLVRLRDGYAWLYLDGRRTMLFCVSENSVRSREPSFDERLDLEISGPSLMKMLARDAVELSAVSHGMDSDMEPGCDVTYDRVESLAPEKAEETISVKIKSVKPAMKIQIPAPFFDEVLEFLSDRLRR
ncbi:MAG: hypothetical protein IKP53_05030 [Candidatus Methanomethylophilaceae archaeon]|nr:hypothetical protein [Candidatus Methanomethylophilaceae archaeon]